MAPINRIKNRTDRSHGLINALAAFGGSPPPVKRDKEVRGKLGREVTELAVAGFAQSHQLGWIGLQYFRDPQDVIERPAGRAGGTVTQPRLGDTGILGKFVQWHV